MLCLGRSAVGDRNAAEQDCKKIGGKPLTQRVSAAGSRSGSDRDGRHVM